MAIDIIDFVKDNLLYIIAAALVLILALVFIVVACKKICKRGRHKTDSYVVIDAKGKRTIVTSKSKVK